MGQVSAVHATSTHQRGDVQEEKAGTPTNISEGNEDTVEHPEASKPDDDSSVISPVLQSGEEESEPQPQHEEDENESKKVGGEEDEETF